jgi:hypothetical protein
VEVVFHFAQNGPNQPRFAHLVLSGDSHPPVQIDRGGDRNQEHHAEPQGQQDFQQRKAGGLALAAAN